MSYTGALSKRLKRAPFTSDIVVKLDTSDTDKWEVLDIEYEDNNNSAGKLTAKPNMKKVQALKTQFNR